MRDFGILFRPNPMINFYAKASDYVISRNKYLADLMGYTQRKNTQDSLNAQIAYEEYLRQGNERALADWHKNLPGRTIKYPEFSYEGQIARSNTSIARAGFDYSTASANYYGNLPYRAAGLYGIASRLSRTL